MVLFVPEASASPASAPSACAAAVAALPRAGRRTLARFDPTLPVVSLLGPASDVSFG
jgi:hypothetical protein